MFHLAKPFVYTPRKTSYQLSLQQTWIRILLCSANLMGRILGPLSFALLMLLSYFVFVFLTDCSRKSFEVVHHFAQQHVRSQKLLMDLIFFRTQGFATRSSRPFNKKIWIGHKNNRTTKNIYLQKFLDRSRMHGKPELWGISA